MFVVYLFPKYQPPRQYQRTLLLSIDQCLSTHVQNATHFFAAFYRRRGGIFSYLLMIAS